MNFLGKLIDSKHSKLKLTEEAEERKRLIEEHERKLEAKKKMADERREKVKRDEQDKADQLKVELHEKR